LGASQIVGNGSRGVDGASGILCFSSWLMPSLSADHDFWDRL